MAKQYTTEELVIAASKSGGVMSFVATALDCAWDTARKNINECPEAKEAFLRAESKMVTAAASQMLSAVKDGERWAIERILDTRGRRDGLALVNRTEISGPEGAPIASQSRVIEIDPAMLEAAVKDAAKLIAERQLALSDEK